MNRRRDWPKFYRLCEYVVYGWLRVYRLKDPLPQLEGSWHSNDTIWRTCLDLNRALLYADKAGRMQDVPQREEISIVDAIVAGRAKGRWRPIRWQPARCSPCAIRPSATGSARACWASMKRKSPCCATPATTCAGGSAPRARVASVRSAVSGARPPKAWAGHLELPRGETGRP
jgi:hypothetical protein